MRKRLLLSLAIATITGAMTTNAQNTIDIQGVVYNLDTITHVKVGPGTTHTHLELIKQDNATSKLQVHYLTIDQTTPRVSIRAVCATDKVAGSETVSNMAKRKSGNGTLYFAGSNGDFYTTSGAATNGTSKIGSPTTSCTVDREIYKTSNSNYQFTIDTEGVARIGRLNYYTGTATLGDKVTLFKGVNVGSPSNGITLYTPKYWGSTNQVDYTDNCAEVTAKLVAGENFYAGTKFRLEVTSAPNSSGDTQIPSDGFVIFGRGTSTSGCNTGALDFVKNLKVGDIVEFDNIVLYSPIAGDGTDLRIVPTQIVSGNPKTVGNGVTLDTESERGDASSLHPRTGIGISQSGDSIIMMVIEGRYTLSAGVRTSMLGDVMRYAGAWEACNLDGGGSSTLYTSALGVRNYCSDGSQRAVGNAIFATVDAPEDKTITEIRFVDWVMRAPKYGIYTPKMYGYNQYGVLVDTDLKGFTLSCPDALGEIINDGTTLFGNGSGTHALTATYNGITATIPVTVESTIPEIKYPEVVLDNYRQWPVDVQSLVNGEYMALSPEAMTWTTSDESVVTINPATGIAQGLKDGKAILTGTVGDFTGSVNVTVQCPKDRVIPVLPQSEYASWKTTTSSITSCTTSALSNGLAFDYVIKSTRGPQIKITQDSLKMWSLPDSLRIRIKPVGDATITSLTISLRANNATPQSFKFEEIVSGVENVLNIPMSDLGSANDVGIYPVTINNMMIMLKGSTATNYRIEMPGIEGIYVNAPASIDQIIADGNEADIIIADGVISTPDIVEAIEVYNLAGQKVASATNANSIATPTAGTYIVKVVNNAVAKAKKIIL